MREVPRRETIARLGEAARRHGVIFEVEPDRGKGGHQGFVFRDEARAEKIWFTIGGGKKISPGVQRNALAYVESRIVNDALGAGHRALAIIVKRILLACFK